MASKKKKKKVTKATPSTFKVVKGNHYLIDEIQEDLKKDLQEKFFKALQNTPPTSQGIMQVMHPPMQQYPKQSSKSWASAHFLSSYTGEDAKQHKWLTWMKQQMLKLSPQVFKVDVIKDAEWHAVKFEIVLTYLGKHHKVAQSISMETIHHAFSTGTEEDWGHEVLKNLKNQIDAIVPSPSKGAPGNMTIVPVEGMDPNKMFIVPPDMHKGLSEYANSLQGGFKTLAAKWLEEHKPPPPPIPVPPDEDKDYKNSPVVDYNMALKKIENHAKDIGGAGKIWGEMYNTVQHYEKEKILAQKKAHEQGFRGNVVQDSLRQVLPCLYQQVKCPVCQHSDNMADMIIHLNDGEMWSREQIADWAESLDIDISVKETK